MPKKTIKINPIRELLKAGQIVGLQPREMVLTAIEDLERGENSERHQ
jgi:hypothetical protein